MAAGTLFVVATPLGNLQDLSARAIAVLRQVPVVAAEDTRRTRILLQAIGADARLLSWHAHSAEHRRDALLDLLVSGQDVAMVTDAGTPAISDPGGSLVAAARARGLAVVPIPGASAVATLLSVAGLPADRYLFLGFLPRKGGERKRLLARVATEPWSVVLFEAPGRLVPLLSDLVTACGPMRQAVVGRELTKVHEEIVADSLSELAARFATTPVRGEITLVVAGCDPEVEMDREPDPAEVDRMIRELLAEGRSKKEAARLLAEQFGLPRNESYRRVMQCG